MIFNNEEIETDHNVSPRTSYVRADVVIERVEQAVRTKLAYERKYISGDWVNLEDAEEFILKMHSVFNEMKR